MNTTTNRPGWWTDEYEELQDMYSAYEVQDDTGFSVSIFEMPFSGMPRAKMYQAAVTPELFPNERPMVLSNWHPEDLEAYCGGQYVRASK